MPPPSGAYSNRPISAIDVDDTAAIPVARAASELMMTLELSEIRRISADGWLAQHIWLLSKRSGSHTLPET
jgi:hypothetical protein